MKARYFTLLTVVVLGCSACGAPSLRHKKEVNKLLSAGEYAAASSKIESAKNREYKQRDSVLYYLDSASVLHDGHQLHPSDERFALAQAKIEDLFSQSISGHVGRFLINDLTVPYYPAHYERALTYYYRAMNFLQQGNINGALVEANKAVFYLDGLRDSPESYDNAFVQYFASLVFESAGKRDRARIARTRAMQAYGIENLQENFFFNKPVAGWGEVVLVHANGKIPLKKSQTFQLGWSDILLWSQTYPESSTGLSPQVHNAITAGLLGSSVTVAYPVLEDQLYKIKSSEVVLPDGRVFQTLLLGDLSSEIKNELKEKQAGTLFRMAVRVASKRTAAVQARHAAYNASSDAGIGDLAEMFVNFLGALTEKADTRQWFTLPAQLRMTRFYLPAGEQDIVLRFKDGFGNIVGEYVFENIQIKPNDRVYLHYRTAR